jgi:hypothetical protein
VDIVVDDAPRGLVISVGPDEGVEVQLLRGHPERKHSFESE